jgi:hypothetical protein
MNGIGKILNKISHDKYYYYEGEIVDSKEHGYGR